MAIKKKDRGWRRLYSTKTILVIRVFDADTVYAPIIPAHPCMHSSGSQVSPLWIHQPPFSAARVNSRSWTWVSPLSVKTSDQWTRCLKQSQVNTLYHHNLLTNTPLPLPLAWLSHSTPSPLLCLHPSLHLSILSHRLVMLSVRARMCHSWRELLSTTGAQLSSVSFFVFVCLFEGCDGG